MLAFLFADVFQTHLGRKEKAIRKWGKLGERSKEGESSNVEL
jgi:hypothetical protein